MYYEIKIVKSLDNVFWGRREKITRFTEPCEVILQYCVYWVFYIYTSVTTLFNTFSTLVS